MSAYGYFGECVPVDPTDHDTIRFRRAHLAERMHLRERHERARCPGVTVVSESVCVQQEGDSWRVVSDLVLSYPDADMIPVEAR